MEPTKSVVVEDKRQSALKSALKRLLRRKLIRLAILLIVVAILACVGWRIWVHYHKKSPPPNNLLTAAQVNAVPQTISAVKSSSACENTYQDSALCQFAQTVSSFNSTPYSATITVTTPGSTGSYLTLLNDGHGNLELSGKDNGSQITNIYLDHTDYLKQNNDSNYESFMFNYGNNYNPANTMNVGLGTAGLSFKKVGTASCGSLQCLEYSVTSTKSSAIQYVWFDTKGYLLRRWQEVQGNTTTNMTITYPAVTIVAPPQDQVQTVW